MRDYYKEPLKRGEIIPYDELYNLYITQNKSFKDLETFFNTKETMIKRNLRHWGIKKPKDLVSKNISKERTNRITLSYDELYDLYIVQNLGVTDIAKKFNLSKYNVQTDLINANIKKPKELQIEVYRRHCLEKYGVDNPYKLKEIQEKTKDTFKQNRAWKKETEKTSIGTWRDYEKYPLKTRELIPKEDLYELYIVQNLTKKEIGKLLHISPYRVTNCAIKYGFPKPSKLSHANIEKTNIEKYGCKCYLQSKQGKEQVHKTLQEKYNVNCIAHIDGVVEKRKQTCLERYGVENPNQCHEIQEKKKKTMLEKTGYEYAFQVPEVQEKIRQTTLEKYGYEYISQNHEIKQKIQETFKQNYGTAEKRQEIKKRTEQTCLERYGNKNYMKSEYCNIEEIQRKRYNTMKANDTFNRSKPEKEIKELLCKKFTVIMDRKHKNYPFRCDFYIQELNLFIEFQGHVSHGGHPFNIKSNDDLITLHTWLKRSQEFNFKGKKKKSYKGYIQTWIRRDPLKRQTAKENNLNWLEFFNMQEFMDWYNQQ